VGGGGHGVAGVAISAALHWEGQVDYRGLRKVEFGQEGWNEPRDATYRKEAIDEDVALMTRNLFIRGSSAVIQWSDLFVGADGDGVEHRFEDFHEGELIRHQHQVRHTVDGVASSVVHDGYFFCFVCQNPVYVASTLAPDPYPFKDDEINKRDGAGVEGAFYCARRMWIGRKCCSGGSSLCRRPWVRGKRRGWPTYVDTAHSAVRHQYVW
jgi:hypothetical protein